MVRGAKFTILHAAAEQLSRHGRPRGDALKKSSKSLFAAFRRRSCFRSSNPFEYGSYYNHSFQLACATLAILLSVPSALVGVVLGLLITGVTLGLMTLLVALTRIVVRVLYSVIFEVRQESATLTEPTATPQPSRT